MPHVTFIHGIANKPPADELLGIWRRALARDDGINLATRGITSSMVYWADVLYARPAQEEDSHESIGNEAIVEAGDDDLDWTSGLGGDAKDFVDRFAKTLNFDARSPGGDDFEPEAGDGAGFERIPLPWFIKRRLMKALLRDVHHYLFNVAHSPRPGTTYRVQDEIRKRLIEALRRDSAANAGKGAHILVSHSMGTVIAYDCLKRVPDCPRVDALMTIGSPLGIDEVQDQLKPEWTRRDGYPNTRVRTGWANVYDRLDPVALDARLDNDFLLDGQTVVNDQRVTNQGRWRHSIDKYLGQDSLRRILARQLGGDAS
jgi:pimeloyl-ACP methyl ester carboxylesterase